MNTILLFKKRTISTLNDKIQQFLPNIANSANITNIIFVKGFKKKMN
jgi:hypothetical protein